MRNQKSEIRNGVRCSSWGISSVPVLLLAVDTPTVMGGNVWEGPRPIQSDGTRVPFAEAGSIALTLLSLPKSLLASFSLLLASLRLWPISQLQVTSLFLC